MLLIIFMPLVVLRTLPIGVIEEKNTPASSGGGNWSSPRILNSASRKAFEDKIMATTAIEDIEQHKSCHVDRGAVLDY